MAIAWCASLAGARDWPQEVSVPEGRIEQLRGVLGEVEVGELRKVQEEQLAPGPGPAAPSCS